MRQEPRRRDHEGWARYRSPSQTVRQRPVHAGRPGAIDGTYLNRFWIVLWSWLDTRLPKISTPSTGVLLKSLLLRGKALHQVCSNEEDDWPGFHRSPRYRCASR